MKPLSDNEIPILEVQSMRTLWRAPAGSDQAGYAGVPSDVDEHRGLAWNAAPTGHRLRLDVADRAVDAPQPLFSSASRSGCRRSARESRSKSSCHLQREDCDYGQGFLFARPLDADAVTEFLGAEVRDAAATS